MAHNVPLLGGLCFPVILCVYLLLSLLSLYYTTNYVKRFVPPCAYLCLRVIPHYSAFKYIAVISAVKNQR
jgi:hypothetical protein